MFTNTMMLSSLECPDCGRVWGETTCVNTGKIINTQEDVAETYHSFGRMRRLRDDR